MSPIGARSDTQEIIDGSPIDLNIPGKRASLCGRAQHGAAVVQHHGVALGDPGAEGDDVTVAPDVRDDGLAGKHGRRQSHVHRGERVRSIVAAGGDDGVGREPVGAEPMHDRAIETRRPRGARVGVVRVGIAVQSVEQRLLGKRRQGTDGVGSTLGQGVGFKGRSIDPPNPPSPRAKAVW